MFVERQGARKFYEEYKNLHRQLVAFDQNAAQASARMLMHAPSKLKPDLIDQEALPSLFKHGAASLRVHFGPGFLISSAEEARKLIDDLSRVWDSSIDVIAEAVIGNAYRVQLKIV